jgi:hypothetical protein
LSGLSVAELVNVLVVDDSEVVRRLVADVLVECSPARSIATRR